MDGWMICPGETLLMQDAFSMFHGVKMNGYAPFMRKRDGKMEDEVLDLPAIATVRRWQAGRNRNLNRGFRKLAQ